MSVSEILFGEEADILRDPSFQILILANIMAPLGPALVSPILDTLTGPFGTSEAAIGLMISAFSAPGILIIPLAGRLADQYGRRIVLISGLLLFGFGGTAIILTTDFRIVLGLRVIQGIGASGIIPVIVTCIGDIYDGTAEATGQGLRFTSSGISQSVFPALAGLLVVVAWQYPFLIYALSFPIAALVALWFDEPVQTSKSDDGASIGQLLELVLQPHMMALLIVFLTPPFIYFGFLTYVSVLVRLSNGTPGQAGLLVTINSVGYAIAASQAGRITGRFNSRLIPLLGMNAIMGVGLGIIGLTSNMYIFALGSVVLGIGFGVTLPLYRSIATDLAPDHLRASLVSLAEALIRVGGTASPICMGIAIAYTQPTFGVATATRWTVMAVAIGTSLVGIVGLQVMSATAPRG